MHVSDHYPLKPCSANKKLLQPRYTGNTAEHTKNHYDFYLTYELESGEYGAINRYYRLHAKEPHSEDMSLAYDIECPRCHHVLKPIGHFQNCYDLGLYTCPVCDRERGAV